MSAFCRFGVCGPPGLVDGVDLSRIAPDTWRSRLAGAFQDFYRFEFKALNTVGVGDLPRYEEVRAVQSAVREAGGYHIDTVAEDADLTMALLRLGFRVEYEDMALAYTEAPTNANGLMRQRFRWSFGILQAVYKHRGVFARKGALGFVALPNIVIFQILLPLVSPLIDIMFAFGAIWYFIQ